MFSEKRKYFSDTVLPLQGRMYAAALAITGSADDAADAVQTTMMRVWEGIAQGNRPANPAAYCIASVRNASLTIIARRRTGIAIDGNDGIDPPSDDAADSRAELSDARRLMGSLPERERKAVEMNAFAGCSADEIAEALDVTAANARQILSRARRHLRSLFK
ncbi:MAG: sigma-70 family RNA polymerase sigma factor [Muribaculaceae bacterium]|nr:sigma-70 family RNA polymerase sigma factor [Muribaculaceae bacterium]